MNILFLTLSRLYDLNQRGIYSDLMRTFVKNGHKVYVTVPFERNIRRKTELFDSAGAKILGVETLNIQKTNIVEKGIGTILLEHQYMSAIKHYLKDVHFDLVLYSTPPITFNKVIKWAKQRYGAKTYLLLKDIFPQNAVDLNMFSKSSPFYYFFRNKEKQLYKLSDYIGCMSPANVDYVLKHNPAVKQSRVEVCPNSIELLEQTPVEINTIKAKYGIPNEKVLCIYGGNLGKPQGVDFLLEVIEGNEIRLDCHIVIVGNGTEFGKIKSWFDNRHPNHSTLMSALPKSDYDELIRIADIGLIFLDRRFTIPNYPSRLLSYMENRIPIMMAIDKNTDIGTIAETNGFGFWAENGDLTSFNRKLDMLVADRNLRIQMGRTGYQYLADNYSVDESYRIIMKHFVQYV